MSETSSSGANISEGIMDGWMEGVRGDYVVPEGFGPQKRHRSMEVITLLDNVPVGIMHDILLRS